MEQIASFCPWLMVLSVLAFASLAHSASPTTRPVVDYAVIVTGGELLGGAYPDGHTVFITRTLRPLGMHCVLSLTVDDRPADITEALRFARTKAPIVIVTGGLGPTDNDITAQSLCDATGIPLRENEDVVQDMEKRFRTPRDQLRPGLRRQARTPEHGTYLKNPNGTAVGLVFETGESVVVALPGPPRELQPMVRDELIPYLGRKFGAHSTGSSIMLRFVGVGQSQISQSLKDSVAMPPDVTQFSSFEGGRVDFVFSLPEDTPAARRKLADHKSAIIKILGDSIYADDETSLEECVARLFSQRKATLALAEAGSGGALSAALGGAESGRKILAGAWAAPTDTKLRRLLHVTDDAWNAAASAADQGALMSAAAAREAASDWALSVSEAQRDPAGGSYVEVVIRQPDGKTTTQRFSVRGTGELVRAGLTTQLLDLLRRKLR